MQADHTQPLTIDEVLTDIGRKKIFTKLDINQAYWQIPFSKESRQYTGFIFDHQTYVFKRLSFGLKTAGASFTRAIEEALNDKSEIGANIIIYLDDVLVASETETEHLEHIRKIFDALKRTGFRLNQDKCEFARDKVIFLGHEISKVHVKITNETKKNILDFPRLKNKKELQAFLGLVNWDRRFAPNLSRYTSAIEKLLWKNERYQWSDEMEQSFQQTKQAVKNANRLYLLDPEFELGIETDASTIGLERS